MVEISILDMNQCTHVLNQIEHKYHDSNGKEKKWVVESLLLTPFSLYTIMIMYIIIVLIRLNILKKKIMIVRSVLLTSDVCRSITML